MNTNAVESLVNRAMILDSKVKSLELEKAILLDVVSEAKKFCASANDLGYHLLPLKNVLERVETLVKPHG